MTQVSVGHGLVCKVQAGWREVCSCPSDLVGVKHASIGVPSTCFKDQEEQRTAGVSIENVSKEWSGNPVYIRLFACSYT